MKGSSHYLLDIPEDRSHMFPNTIDKKTKRFLGSKDSMECWSFYIYKEVIHGTFTGSSRRTATLMTLWFDTNILIGYFPPTI